MIIRFDEYKKKCGEKIMCKEFISQIRSKYKMDMSAISEHTLYEEMEKCADEIIAYYKLRLTDEGYPIISILTDLGIKTYQNDFNDEKLSGYLAINPKYIEQYNTTRLACVNKKDNFGHKRFTLAHELAHYLFDFQEETQTVYYNTYYIDGYNEKTLPEKRANFFAASLLMPRNIFISKYHEFFDKHHHSLIDTMNELAKAFGVSGTAVQRRCEYLNLVNNNKESN